MTGSTTIRLSDHAKKKLEHEQLPGESFEQTIMRLLGETEGRAWTEAEIRELIEESCHD